jgi:hypothetical protein
VARETAPRARGAVAVRKCSAAAAAACLLESCSVRGGLEGTPPSRGERSSER